MKKLSIIILAAAAAVFCGCSVVFDGSINGKVVDGGIYDHGSGEGAGIGDMTVYLYTEEKDWTADYDAWAGGRGRLPNEAEETTYFTSTQTDDSGAYVFTGFVWKTIFPEFGKTADRKEIYLLFYHKDYGLQKNSQPIMAVSDNTARLPLMKLDTDKAVIKGCVKDAYKDLGEDGVNVLVYMPVFHADSEANLKADKAYNADDHFYMKSSMAGNTVWVAYDRIPYAAGKTSGYGDFNVPVKYKLLDGYNSVGGKTCALLAFSKEGFETGAALDPRLSAGVDINGDGETNPDDSVYSVGDRKWNNTIEIGDDFPILRTEFHQVVEGYYKPSSAGDSGNGKTVKLVLTEKSGRTREFKATTRERKLGSDSPVVRDGYFSFNDVYWEEALDEDDADKYECEAVFSIEGVTLAKHPDKISYSDTPVFVELEE